MDVFHILAALHCTKQQANDMYLAILACILLLLVGIGICIGKVMYCETSDGMELDSLQNSDNM